MSLVLFVDVWCCCLLLSRDLLLFVCVVRVSLFHFLVCLLCGLLLSLFDVVNCLGCLWLFVVAGGGCVGGVCCSSLLFGVRVVLFVVMG